MSSLLKRCFVSGFALMMVGCSQHAPDCDDSDAMDLVLEIVQEELVKEIGSEMAASVDLELDAIRTTDINEKTGARECASELLIEGPSGETSVDITYTSELTDESGEFYITVYGL
ncbi:hypothetical protein EZV61_01120 [Corallincola luteus]|uniref:Uncharacterized protein n=1 Tax=Corallincola luteus TaxID=1775177 RepID=A0ABY2AN34_9GAMM|nr:hypothetical protein [Corallincola luteus]TCI04610.1 hypothetical protein EZV61_01120 [Corallincola luteus]